MPGKMTPLQKRCAVLATRCFTGFDHRDKEKKNPIPEYIALEEWKELLAKRFLQARTGGKAFVLKILRIWETEKTDEGLDLHDKPKICQYLSKWCKEMCNDHNINPGSEVMQALEQQLGWHEEQMDAHQATQKLVQESAQQLKEILMGENNQEEEKRRQKEERRKEEDKKLKPRPEEDLSEYSYSDEKEENNQEEERKKNEEERKKKEEEEKRQQEEEEEKRRQEEQKRQEEEEKRKQEEEKGQEEDKGKKRKQKEEKKRDDSSDSDSSIGNAKRLKWFDNNTMFCWQSEHKLYNDEDKLQNHTKHIRAIAKHFTKYRDHLRKYQSLRKEQDKDAVKKYEKRMRKFMRKRESLMQALVDTPSSSSDEDNKDDE